MGGSAWLLQLWPEIEKHFIGQVTLLVTEVWELEPKARTMNLLEAYGVKYVGDLVILDRDELRSWRGMGRSTLADIERMLSERGANLESTVPGWRYEKIDPDQPLKFIRPENIEQLSERYRDHY